MINTDVIDEILESLILVSGAGLKVDEIASQLEIKTSEVNSAIKRLKEKYSGKCGIHLITYNGKVQFASNPEYKNVIACVLNPIKERDLSTAALETIAIIAYRQPVTRLDIEQIRGVNSEYTVQVLLQNNLIEIVGRKDAPGRPLLFGTTDEFLKRFRLDNINDLPNYEELLESIKLINDGADNKSIYNEFEIPDEETAVSSTQENENAKSVESKSSKKHNTTQNDDDLELPDEEIPEFLMNEEGLERIE